MPSGPTWKAPAGYVSPAIARLASTASAASVTTRCPDRPSAVSPAALGEAGQVDGVAGDEIGEGAKEPDGVVDRDGAGAIEGDGLTGIDTAVELHGGAAGHSNRAGDTVAGWSARSRATMWPPAPASSVPSLVRPCDRVTLKLPPVASAMICPRLTTAAPPSNVESCRRYSSTVTLAASVSVSTASSSSDHAVAAEQDDRVVEGLLSSTLRKLLPIACRHRRWCRAGRRWRSRRSGRQ